MWRWYHSLLVGLGLALAATAMGGGQINVDRIEEAWTCQIVAHDATVAANDATTCNYHALGSGFVAAASLVKNQHVPFNRDLLIEDWGLVVLDTLGITEVCDIDLMADNTPTGAGSSVSRITTNGATTCDEGAAQDLDVAGEVCTRSQINHLIQGGGYMRFQFSGANCTVFEGALLWARGRFLP